MISLARNLWRHRGLTLSLMWREVLARYKQSLLGPTWAFFQPLLLMLTFSFVHTFVSFPSDGMPYPVFAYAALVPWTMFQNAIALATPSIVLNAAIIKKIYFPREVFPVSATLVSLFDFAMAMLMLFGLMIYYGVQPNVWVALLPALLAIELMLALGVGLLSSAIGTFKRDIIFAAVFVLQIWMYASPVIYPLSSVPARYRTLYLLNPMAGIIDGFRTILVGSGPPDWNALGISLVGALAALVVGHTVFKALERWYADVV